MKRVFFLSLAVCFFACHGSQAKAQPQPAGDENRARVMTCNIRVTGLPADEVEGRRWEERRGVCVEVIRKRNPDIICMQEVIYDSYRDMKREFSEYFAFGFPGPEMDPYTEGYHLIAKNVIFFRRDRYELESAGCYWLSETPLIGGSESWNTGRARHCNWVRLRDKKTGKQFRVLDTHLDHISEEARQAQTKCIIGECAQYAADFPQIMCGDFNTGIGMASINSLREAGWGEMYEDIHGPGEAGFTCHVFMGAEYAKNNRRIDFIFTRGPVKTLGAEIVRDSVDGVYPSDHYFVTADFVIR